MATTQDYVLTAHLMRRAGFGASWPEIERLSGQNYEQIVEELLHPEDRPPVDEFLLYRYHPTTELPGGNVAQGQANYLFHMINTPRPLEEKLALFWHQVFATGNNKVDNCNHLIDQIQMFRDHGMGNYRDMLLRIARDPAMIFWLDNQENHKYAPNENWGRELLELFSMGVGTYSETDVFEASRAFTGWTVSAKMPRFPYGRFPWSFEFRPEDHDEGDKTFLGHTGNLNGDDIIDIVVEQPACHRFIARHLYNFFVADEPQVPAWQIEEPRDPAAVDAIARVFVESNLEIKPVLRFILNSDFFKSEAVRFQRVKSPAEVVVGTVNMIDEFKGPVPYLEIDLSRQAGYMGQDILDPPSVEGWHTGKEWINSGSLVARINFVAGMVSNPEHKGVRDIIDRVVAEPAAASPEGLVDSTLKYMGMVEVGDDTRRELVEYARGASPIAVNEGGNGSGNGSGDAAVMEMMSLIAATREYQFC
jgi:uncharacterized protein (DUF1800 family)